MEAGTWHGKNSNVCLFHKKVNIDGLRQTDLAIFTIKKKKKEFSPIKKVQGTQDLSRLC